MSWWLRGDIWCQIWVGVGSTLKRAKGANPFLEPILIYCWLDLWNKLKSVKWRHNEHNGVSNHQPHDCLLIPFIQDADQRKHQSSVWLAFVRGIHRWPVNSLHKGPITRKMFPFDDIAMRNLNKIMRSCCQEHAFKDVVCEMLLILFRVQYIKLLQTIKNIWRTFYARLLYECLRLLVHNHDHVIDISRLDLAHVVILRIWMPGG